MTHRDRTRRGALGPARFGLSTAWPVVVLLLAMVSMQIGAACAKALFPTVGVPGVTALRLGFSALVLTFAQRPWRIRLKPESLGALTAYGLSLGAMNTLFYMALREIPLGIAIALEFIGPLSIGLLTSRRWTDLLWIGLAALGLLLLLPVWRGLPAINAKGAGLALASGAFWAVYILVGRRVGKELGAPGAALGMIIAAVAFAPPAALVAGTRLLDPQILLVGLLLAILSSALPYSLEMVALARLPTPAFGAMMSLEPAVGAIAGGLVLRELPAPVQWIGIAAVVLASVGASLTQSQSHGVKPAGV